MSAASVIDPTARLESGPAPPQRRSIEISARTMLVAAAVIGGLWVLVRLWPVLLVVAVSLILVGTLNPVVGALQRRGFGRGLAVAATLLTVLAVIAGLGLVTVPALWAELSSVVHDLPQLQQRAAAWLGHSAFTAPLAESIRTADPGKLFVGTSREAMAVSSEFGARLGYAATAIALAVYMLVDPERSQGALYTVVPRQYHVRLARILLNLETIVGGYMRGQILTSAAIGVYVFTLLTAFRMPNAIAFAIFAAAADVIPFVGGALTLIPIVLAALPHGKIVTVVLIALVILYQEVENRILIPRIYGRVLRLSAAAVTVALLVGGQLLGILGALLALPFAAGLRMVVEELRVELPGQPGESPETRARDERDERAEEAYEALTAGAPAQEAAVVAVAIADEIRKGNAQAEHTPAPRGLEAGAKI
jgi:predicted PurR-regulated permease PerM